MKKYLVILVSLVVSTVQAQQILVPDNVYFADIHLTIDKNARARIQQNVDALLKHPVYFQQKVDRADTYFPIIEREFRKAGLPDDFKFLAIQESGLVSDAISTSKAEGFWQFKRETATDFGLAVNPNVDERRHIIEASRGAAKYFLQSNAYYKNWVNTMVSYYMGFTGAKAYARPGDADSKDMLVTDKTHVYFLTFLAHKIAFENFVGKNPQPAITLRELRANPGQSLGEIALANQTDPVEVERYNRWLLGGTIPADKEYTVIIPVANAMASTVMVAGNSQELAPTIIVNKTLNNDKNPEFATMNGLKVIVAQAGDTKDKLALQARMSTKKFLRLNDLYSFDQIVPGKVYYLEKKKTRANVEYHTAQNGETLLDIAQMYGMRLKAILSKNRMKKNEALVAGRVLWLQKTRPASVAVEYRRLDTTPLPPKTPQPLQTETIAQNGTKKSSETLADIKDVASNTLQKAGAALQIPERRPQVAQVGGDVFEETIELNPKAATVPAEEDDDDDSETVLKTEYELAKLNAPAAQTSEASIVTPVATETVTTTTTSPASTPVTPVAEPVESRAAAPKTTEKPAALYPKTVAKTPEKVTQAPKPAEPVESVEVVETVEKPKVVLREPVTEPAKKTVTVPVNKPAKETVSAKPASHKVAKGETLYSISKKYNVSPSDLKYWNSLGEKPLAIGQELKVSGEPQPVMPVLTVTGTDQPVAEGTVVNITHKVGEGESMYQISRKYGVSIKEIMEWNNKSDFNVSAGDELTIRSRPGNSRN
ncbi:lytic transglycosylase domain-containing protein [Adhaeribacter soli]|uniref:LysM peptidoglycan-binding domain-containing protein n=1 Tax=Adhaeribacter soli TaxID=2607655 RepID=A0A5N1IWM9_9BACT|nr:lytic transglycosylase domain-containing protein [Adhaeribacter soli]KAA9333556.1 LysM peptidoglycan-binding domain-containing protein [Adhaeribacter soli]